MKQLYLVIDISFRGVNTVCMQIIIRFLSVFILLLHALIFIGCSSKSSSPDLALLAGLLGLQPPADFGDINGDNAPPTIAYPLSSFSFVMGSSIPTMAPEITALPITNCASSPALPAGLTLAPTNCELSGTPSTTQDATDYTIIASNSYGTGQTTIEITITATGIAPTINYTPDFLVALTGKEVSPPLTPSLSGSILSSCDSGAPLPAGLVLNPLTCSISGTPTEVVSPTQFTITATNPYGSATATVDIQIIDGGLLTGYPPFFLYQFASYMFTQGTAIETIYPLLLSVTPATCSSSPTLPAGLFLNASTCVISGTPTATQITTDYTITATNSNGSTPITIHIAVNGPGTTPGIGYTGSPFTFTENTAITTLTPTLSGYAPTDCNSSPSLPDGLSINSATCAISGTPTTAQSATDYTITATNEFGSGDTTISITVEMQPLPPGISYSGTPFVLIQNHTISNIAPTLSGGTPTACSSTPALPVGLTLNPSSCTISGTPTTVLGSATYTITATNAYGSDNTTISIQVADNIPPHTTASISGGYFRTAQSVTLSCVDSNYGCKRIIYTVDGSMPTFSPQNGTIVNGNSTSPIAINSSTALRYRSENNVGVVEPYEETYIGISSSGFLYVAYSSGLAIGEGKVPSSYRSSSRFGQRVFYDTDTEILYGTVGGVGISLDNGNTWTTRELGFGSPNAVFASGPNIYVAGAYDGVYISTDGGDSFVNRTMSDGLGHSNVNGIVASGSNVYAATDAGLSISTDGGVSFVNRTTMDGMGGDIVQNVYLYGSTIYAATNGGLSVSTDGGVSFTNITASNGLGSNLTNALYLDGANMYVATDGGLSISTDGGASFVNCTTANGLGHSGVRDVTISGSTIYAATNGGLSISTDGGASFVNRTILDGIGDGYTNFTRAVSEVNGRLFVGTYTGISFSDDGGTTFINHTWTNGLRSSPQDLFVDGSKVYVGVLAKGIAISNNGGGSFTHRTEADGLGSKYVYDVYASGSNVYVATYAGLSISTDGGTSFVNRTTSDGLGSNNVHGVTVQGSTVVAATSGGLSISTDGGATFVNRDSSNGLPAINTWNTTMTGNAYYVTTDSGLAYSADGLTFFTDAGVGSSTLKDVYALPNTVYFDDDLYIATSDGLYVGRNQTYTLYPLPSMDSSTAASCVFAYKEPGSNEATIYAGTSSYGLQIMEAGSTSFQSANPTMSSYYNVYDVMYAP